MAACGNGQSGNCDDCVQVVRNVKTVQVPCTRNKYLKYTVKVPRQVTQQVPRTVRYTDFETRSKQVPYTDYRSERRTRMETQKYQVPVTTMHTKMVNVTKKVPKTVYVDMTTQVPKSYKRTSMQTKERQAPVPYFVNVPETKYRTVTEQVPVQKSKVQMDTVTKTVYDTQIRTRCVPETKIVTKQIPVYNVVARPPPPIPANAGFGSGDVAADFDRIDKDGDGMLNYNGVASDAVDANKESQLSFDEYAAARASGNLGNTADNGYAISGSLGQANAGYGQESSGNGYAISGGFGQADAGYGQESSGNGHTISGGLGQASAGYGQVSAGDGYGVSGGFGQANGGYGQEFTGLENNTGDYNNCMNSCYHRYLN